MGSFVYQIDRNETAENVVLSLYSVDDKLKTSFKEVKLPYVIHAQKKGFDKLKIDSDKIVLVSDKLKNIDGEKVVKVEVKSKEIYDYVLKTLKEHNVATYEQDLPYEHRYLIDENFELISGSDFLPLKYVSVDIESVGDPEFQEIVLISSQSPFDKSMNKVYVDRSKINSKHMRLVENHKYVGFEIVILKDEKEMLEKFREDIINFKPQAIIGWNVIDFDFKVIKERMDLYKIPFSFSDFTGECKLRLYNDFFKNSTMSCPGVLVFDIINVLRMNFISFDDYKLDTVAREVLGDNKIELANDEDADAGIDEKISVITNMLMNDPVKLIEYNFKDSLLTTEITEKLKLMELICKRSILTGTPLAKVKSPIATLDIMYLKELHKRDQVAPSNFNFDASNPIEGAFVLDPKKGFYEDVFVLDFKSLYPTVMMTFNVDPFTFSKSGQIRAPNGAKFDAKESGILPELILTLFKEREKAKKEKDQIKSFALKINMNSFYGAVASPKCRFHNHDIGEAITSFARQIIKDTNKFVESLGHEVIYNDTDSIFLRSSKKFKSLDEKIAFGKSIEVKINDYFEKWVTEKFKRKTFLSIEFEKLFSKFFIATKKRYVGYDELSKKTSYTGMEAIRGDWTPLAKNFQMKIVDLIFSGKNSDEISKFTLSEIENLRKGRYDDKLVYTKKITKPLAQYTKTTPPHVKAAREVKGFEGRRVRYVMTKDGPKHVSLIGKDVDYDYEHYVEKQLKGVSDDLLDSFGVDFDAVVFKKKQKSLDGFF